MCKLKNKRNPRKDAFDGVISRLDPAGKRISDLDYMTIGRSQSEKQNENETQNRQYKNCEITIKHKVYQCHGNLRRNRNIF
jgi:hypothetical protein